MVEFSRGNEGRSLSLNSAIHNGTEPIDGGSNRPTSTTNLNTETKTRKISFEGFERVANFQLTLYELT